MKWTRGAIVAVVGLSAMAGVRESHIAAQAGNAPTVGVRRNPVFVGPVWPGDFNGDGVADLAGRSEDPANPYDPDVVTIALGKGDGTFGPPIRWNVIGTVLGVGDFDNDGKLDVLEQYLDTDEYLTVLGGNGDGTIGPSGGLVTGTFHTFFAMAADLDGDGNLDVVVGCENEVFGGDQAQIVVVRGNGDLTFDWQNPTVIPASLDPVNGAIADVNADGRKDIVIANHDGHSLTVLLNRGSFAFAASDIGVVRAANGVAAADVNGDGNVDLLVAASDSFATGSGFREGYALVLLGNGDGTFRPPVEYATPPGALRVAVDDFTRDGKLDIATANNSSMIVNDCGPPWKTWASLSILPGNGNGTFGTASNFSIGSQQNVDDQVTARNGVWSVSTSDLNGDRAADLIVSNGTVFLNQPADPNWPPTVTASSTQPAADHSITLFAAADDVDQDMLTYSWIDSGGTTIPPVPNPCFRPSILGVHTFTVTVGDGHGHTASSSVTVDFGGGGGSTAPIMTLTAPTAGATIAAGTPYQIKFHIDDPSMALYEWTIDYSLDNGATWGHIWECHNAGQPSQPGVPTSRDDSCTWRNPGPPSAQAILYLYAQDDADALIGTPSSVRVTIAAAEGAVPDPWQHQDIGTVGAAGTATAFDATTFTVRGSGADIWGTADEFHFVYQRTYSALNDQAPFEFTARVDSVENVNAWTKAGLMIRGGLGANAPHAMVVVSPAKGIAFQRRTAAGGVTVSTAGPPVAAPVWLKLAVQGTTVTAYYRKNLTDLWTVVGRQELPDFDDVAIGMVVTSHADGTWATARFSNVAVHYIDAWTSTDIQTTGGSTTSDGVITSVTGKGADVWGTSDQFRFVWTSWYLLDGSMTARVRDVQNVHAWTKAGVMFRERSSTGTQDPSAKYVFVMVTPGKGVSLQYRGTTGGAAASVGAVTGVAPGWVRLTRSGDTYTGSWSKDGVTWSTVGSVSISLNRFQLSAGLAVTSHSAAAATASFDDVRFEDAHPSR